MPPTVTNRYYQRHAAQRATVDADQAEFDALRAGSVTVTSGIYDERVAGAMDDFELNDPPDMERWQQQDVQDDTAVGKVHEELERRASILQDAYPFALADGVLSYSAAGASRIYEFLLMICNSSLGTGEHAELPRLFERVAAKLVGAYFGCNAISIHTGSPRDPAVGTTFRDAMGFVAEQTGEWTWGPEQGLPDEPGHGDGGCDFVVMMAAPDHRQIGQLFILGQCACGNNWQTKYGDLDLKNVGKWFNPLAVVDPVRSFATPHHVTDALLEEASRRAGLFFDRARLTMIARDAADDVFDDATRARLENLISVYTN